MSIASTSVRHRRQKAHLPVYLILVRRHEGPPKIGRVDDAERIDRLVRMVNDLHSAGKSSEQAVTDLSASALMEPLWHLHWPMWNTCMFVAMEVFRS